MDLTSLAQIMDIFKRIFSYVHAQIELGSQLYTCKQNGIASRQKVPIQ